MSRAAVQNIQKKTLQVCQSIKEKTMRLTKQAKPFTVKVKEYTELLFVQLRVLAKSFCEWIKVAFNYYSNTSFMKIDLYLLSQYLFKNPFTISKEFLIQKGEKEIYAYGETPLTTLELIAKQSQLSAKDTIFELGSGRGRGCFWLHAFTGCHVVGVEFIGDFVEKANKVRNQFAVEGVSFRHEDMLKTDLTGATQIYLYGTCLEEKVIKQLIEKFAKLPTGTKIITVSYPLTEYTAQPLFEVMSCFSVPFTWGNGDVYIHQRK